MKGQNAFELLSELDDDMIAAATLPEGRAVAGHRRERRENGFTRFLNSGWGAAMISGVVAIAVLLAIVQAGRQASGYEPDGKSHLAGQPTSGDNVSDGTLEETSEYPSPNNHDDETSTRGPVEMVVEPSPVRVRVGGQTILPQGYVTYLYIDYPDEEGVIIENVYTGVSQRLAELDDELLSLTTTDFTMNFAVEESYCEIALSIYIYDTEGTLCYQYKGSNTVTPDLPDGTYYVVIKTRHIDGSIYGEGVEFAFKLIKLEATAENAPLRLTAGNETVLPEGYVRTETYYDVDVSDYVTVNYAGASTRLAELDDSLPLLTLRADQNFTCSLDAFYEFKSATVYDCHYELYEEYAQLRDLQNICDLPAGIYYLVVTAVFDGTGNSAALEYPVRLVIHESSDEADTSLQVETTYDTALSEGSES